MLKDCTEVATEELFRNTIEFDEVKREEWDDRNPKKQKEE